MQILKRLFQVFFTAPGARPFLVTFAMLISSICDLVGMGALIPLVAQLSADTGTSESYLGQMTIFLFQHFGIDATFNKLLLFVGAALFLKTLIAFLAQGFVAISVANVATGIRTRLLNSTVNAKWAYFVDHQPGEVAAMVAAQAQLAGGAYLSVSQFVVTVLVVSVLLLTAGLVSTKLFLYCLIAVLALAIPLQYIVRRAQQAALLQFATSTDLAVGVQDVISNMKAIKSMAKQSRFVETFMHSIRDLRGFVISMNVLRNAIYYGQDMLATMLVVSGVYVAISVMKTPLSQFLVLGIVFWQIVDGIKRIQLALQDATIAAEGYYGVLAVIERAEGQAELDTGQVKPSLNQSLSLEDLSFSYGERLVLQHVNLSIPANQITVLIGPSGAGKTTLVDLLIGLYRPAQGRILADGVDLQQVSLKAWRSQIGYVPQELTLLRGTVMENITFRDPKLTEKDAEEALRLAGAWDFISALPNGMHTNIGTMGARLSGGQRQRLSLARALVHKPKLLLLDEVTSALDEATEAAICENIESLSGKLTIIAITHRAAWTKIASKTFRVGEGVVTEMVPEAAPPPVAAEAQATVPV